MLNKRIASLHHIKFIAMKKITQKNIKEGNTVLISKSGFFLSIKIISIYKKYDFIKDQNFTFFDAHILEKNCNHSNNFNYSFHGQKMKDLIKEINTSEKFKIK